MTGSPFEPPAMESQATQELSTGEAPKLWKWYVPYCVAMALLYLACLIGGLAMTFNASWMANEAEEPPMLFLIQGIALAIIGGGLFVLYATALLLPRRKLAWILGFVTIGVGLTSACCWPASIPLLIFWLKEDNKRYMGV